MKILLPVAAGMLALAVVTPATAADLPLPTKAPPAAPAYNWTGFYVGGNIGYGWGRTDNSGPLIGGFVPTPTYSGSGNSSGMLGGGQIGYNYQFSNRWLLGIEADIDWTDIKGSSNACATAGPVIFGCSTTTTKLDDFGTVRGRLGYAWDNLLLYGTGGWAWGRSSSTDTLTCWGGGCPAVTLPITANVGSASANLSGWAAGAGFEYGFLPNWTFRAEYLHLQFDNIGMNYGIAGFIGGVTPFAFTAQNQANTGIDIVRVGVNYLFNWAPAAITAKY